MAASRALAGAPDLILADEPTNNLDSQNAETVMQLFAELHGAGATLCMVTHDAGLGARAAHRAHARRPRADGSAAGGVKRLNPGQRHGTV